MLIKFRLGTNNLQVNLIKQPLGNKYIENNLIYMQNISIHIVKDEKPQIKIIEKNIIQLKQP